MNRTLQESKNYSIDELKQENFIYDEYSRDINFINNKAIYKVNIFFFIVSFIPLASLFFIKNKSDF